MSEPAAAGRETALGVEFPVLDRMADANRMAQENVSAAIAAGTGLASAINEANQRATALMIDLLRDGYREFAALAETRSASELTTLRLAYWKRRVDRLNAEGKAMGDITVRTAELTLGSWAAAVDRLANSFR